MLDPSPALLSRIIVEHVGDGIVLTDAEGLVVWINPAFTRLSGYELSDLLGRRPGDVLQGPGTTEESKTILARAIATRTPCRVDVVNYARSGHAYTCEISLSPIRDESGTLTHFVAIQRDVSEQRALKQESIDFKAYQRALEQQAIVSVTDARGRITFVNPKFCEISGYEAEELIGQTHRIVNSGTHERGFFTRMWRTIRMGETWHGEVCNRTKSGDLYWVDTTVVPVHGARGEILRYVSTRYDITDRKQSEVELVRLTQTDTLTGLANRARFSATLKEIVAQDGAEGLVVMIDLDDFKDLNDSMGHHVGDLLLKEAARCLVEFVGPEGMVARLGGDEFAAIVPARRVGEPRRFVANLHRAASEPVSLDGAIYIPSFSMGVAQYPSDARTAEGLLIDADIALYDAKRNGRRTWRFFDPLVRQRLEQRNRLKAIVTEALDRDGFEIVLQPICRAGTREHTGFEVLARLTHEGAPVPPDQFIPVAEEYGLISEIGRRIFEKAFAAFREMAGLGLAPGRMALNVAAPQFREPGFAEDLQDLLFQYGMVPSDLVIEITETALIGRSTEVVSEVLGRLREIGVRIALDDFGTGFSSLAHLRDLSVDKIKIDKRFVQNLDHAPEDRALVRGLVELAHCLDLEVVAEGVETEAQFDLVREFGADFVQGYVHARPLTVADAIGFLQRGKQARLMRA